MVLMPSECSGLCRLGRRIILLRYLEEYQAMELVKGRKQLISKVSQLFILGLRRGYFGFRIMEL